MPHPKRTWSPAEDAAIRDLRAQGKSWAAVAAAIGVNRFTAAERANQLDVRHLMAARFRAAPAQGADDHHRDPLPPGHPVTWGAITAGTVLAGETYAWRSPLAREATRMQGAFA